MAQETTKARESRRAIITRLASIGKALIAARQPALVPLFEMLENRLKNQTTCSDRWETVDARINKLLNLIDSSIHKNSWTAIEGDCKRIEGLITDRGLEIIQTVDRSGFFAWLLGGRKSGGPAVAANFEKLTIPELEEIQRELKDGSYYDERAMKEKAEEVNIGSKKLNDILSQFSAAQKSA